MIWFLTKTYGVQLKGVDTPSNHLGDDFLGDPNGTLARRASYYVRKILYSYLAMVD
jgi:hypothetical protein